MAIAFNTECCSTATDKVQALKLWQLSFGFVRLVGTSKTFWKSYNRSVIYNDKLKPYG